MDKRGTVKLGLGATLVVLLALASTLQRGPAPLPEHAAGSASGWAADRPFSIARRALAAASDGRHLYVLGGIDGSGHYIDTVEYAAINPDGSLAPWRRTEPLREPRFYLGAAIVAGRLYAIGGASGPRGDANIPSASVEVATINPDGSLQPWEAGPTLTSARRGLQVVTIDRRIYALGGYNGMFLRTAERGDIDGSGHLDGWQAAPVLANMDRYIHAAAAHENRIYLLAGHMQGGNAMSYGSVESAAVADDGSIAPWRNEGGRLLTPRFLASATAAQGRLFLLGGHDGARQLDRVEWAPIGAGGRVGPWQDGPRLNQARSAAAVVATGTHIYIAGGAHADQALNSVERLALPR